MRYQLLCVAAICSRFVQSAYQPEVQWPLTGLLEQSLTSEVFDEPSEPANIDLVNQHNFDLTVQVTGFDQETNQRFFILDKENGFKFYYPDAPDKNGTLIDAPINITISAMQTVSLSLSRYVYSTRIYYAEQPGLGFYANRNLDNSFALIEPSPDNPSDPSAKVNWGFVELAFDSSVLFANLSYVDFVGLLAHMKLESRDDTVPDQIVQGLPEGSMIDICHQLTDQAGADSRPWDQLCIPSATNPLRILGPLKMLAATQQGFTDYYKAYIDLVWTEFQGQDLTVNTQINGLNVTGRVDDKENLVINYPGIDGDYQKPVTSDVWGCASGPFVNAGTKLFTNIGTRLCAAFHRTTYRITGGDVQPNGVSQSLYYMNEPTNHYSRIVHELETDKRGYAFPYDDVTPDGGVDPSGALSMGNAKLLTVSIGGPV